MKAALIRRHGGPEVVEVVERDAPRPGPGELAVEVAAAGVNFIDVYQRQGLYPLELPAVLGNEGAGTVVAVGEGVQAISVGDKVAWTGVLGSYSSVALVPAAMAVGVPDGTDVRVAAAVMLQGMTAHYLSHSTWAIGPGDVAVVHAAAGGVGLLLTQMAKQRGGRVVATASTGQKRDLATGAGADRAVPYDQMPAAVAELSEGRGANVVYDGVGRSTFDRSLSVLAPRGMLVLYGQSSGPVPPFDLQRLNAGGSLFITRPSLGHYISTRTDLESRARDLFAWVLQGKLDVRIGGLYALDDVRNAHQDLEARRTTGKLLLIP
ncbi:MAG: quinone oxidoreductase [Actinomycetota bacterium]|nr:quinone oxidoreductase [Actinomycetota bacterium]